MLRRGLMAAAVLAVSAGASAQTEKLPEARAVPQIQAPILPGVDSTKVKVMRLDASGHVRSEIAVPAPAPPPEKSAVAPPPPIKVKVYRVEPNGRMHPPGEAER